jgi:hypothetical protein
MSSTILPFQRPVSAGEVLDTGFRLFKASLVRCLPLSLAAVVMGQLPTVYTLASGRRPSVSLETDPMDLLLVIVAGLANVLLWGAILLRQHAIAYGQASTLSADLRRVLSLLVPSIAMVLLSVLLIAVGLVLLVVPGLYLAVALLFAYPAMLLDGQSVTGAIRASLRLVRGNWWRTSLVLTVALFAVIVFYAVGSVVGLILSRLVGGGDVGTVFLVTSVITALIGALFTPFMVALSLAQYDDLKLRRDGVDLASRIDALPGG